MSDPFLLPVTAVHRRVGLFRVWRQRHAVILYVFFIDTAYHGFDLGIDKRGYEQRHGLHGERQRKIQQCTRCRGKRKAARGHENNQLIRSAEHVNHGEPYYAANEHRRKFERFKASEGYARDVSAAYHAYQIAESGLENIGIAAAVSEHGQAYHAENKVQQLCRRTVERADYYAAEYGEKRLQRYGQRLDIIPYKRAYDREHGEVAYPYKTL